MNYIKSYKIFESKKVKCKCGWSWKLSEGGNDPFICHKCNHDNTPKKSS